ncbi:MAG: sugar-binding protein [Actinomycetes bacterium]|jgi:putative multiple sugar transport system substrate-binding protein|nr:sugar-binding protein [Actinomycetes bacterium]
MKSIVSVLVAFLLIGALGIVGCAKKVEAPIADDGGVAPTGRLKIGVSMPTRSLQRWNQDGANLKASFEAAGYEVDLQYAGDNDVSAQISHIQNMISGGCGALVIAAVDDNSLTEVLKGAAEANISVIAYDRLIKNSDAVAYYATFDNEEIGRAQATFIKDALKLDAAVAGKDSFTIELFAGDLADSNADFFFQGAMDVLQPYLDKGTLKVLSGQTTREQCAIPNWNTGESQKRMEGLISSNGYGPEETRLDAVLSANDSLANGITNALVDAGYTADDFPLVTGQDCDTASVQNMLKGLQSMSVFKDTRKLASRAVLMVSSIVAGEEPEINAPDLYDNGQGLRVLTYQEDSRVVVKDDIQTVLVDSGYYQPADIGL